MNNETKFTLNAKVSTYSGLVPFVCFGSSTKDVKNKFYDRIIRLSKTFVNPTTEGCYSIETNDGVEEKSTIEIKKLKNGNVVVSFGKENYRLWTS